MFRILLLTICLVLASRADADEIDLTALSLEDLMDIEVGLTSRTEERLFDTPAAVYVLTREDLIRSGATSIPEALRLVPGMEVARLDANKWAVSARGFNGRFAQHLLVLIDGRAVYTSFFSGVVWEVQDVLLEEVERIEVIRGPGGTLWGANAVNGIIDIVTRKASESRGAFVKVGGGTEERGFVRLRYGGMLDTDTDFRVYAKGFAHDSFVDAAGDPGADDWTMRRVGFRVDRKMGEDGNLTWQGDFYRGDRGQQYRLPTLIPPYAKVIEGDSRLTGGNLLGRWRQDLSATSDLRLQVYYDRTEWADTLINETRDTWDFDFQHGFDLGHRQEMIWGMGYRFTRDRFRNSPAFSLDPERGSLSLYSAFIQERIGLWPERLQLFLGSKFEHNDYTGFEYQPSARLLWTPHPRQVFWAAATRAVRTPSRSENDVRVLNRTLPVGSLFADSPPTLVVLAGDRGLEAERVLSFEAGYRIRPREGLSLDLAGHYSDYAGLRSGRVTLPEFVEEPVPHLVELFPADNILQGELYGLELTIDWQMPREKGRLRAGYSHLQIELRADIQTEPLDVTDEGGSPAHQFFFWPSLNLRRDLRLDGVFRYVDRLPSRGIDLSSREIGRYVDLDLRFAWRPIDLLELSLVGQNLIDAPHPEFNNIVVDIVSTEAQPGVYGAITWEFQR
jgi:iron complex outermembrane recepter protein